MKPIMSYLSNFNVFVFMYRNMVDMLVVLLKIKDIIIIIVKYLYRGFCFLLRYLWSCICFLSVIFNGRGETGDNKKIIDSELNRTSFEPEMSDDNSDIDENLAKKKEMQSKKKLKQQNNNHITASASIDEPGLRKRNVNTSTKHKIDAPYCQVCGSENATKFCKGPRCYEFFCTECDVLYHKHPRRQIHTRGGIANYVKTEKSISSSDVAVAGSSTSNVQQNSSANVAKSSSTNSFQKDMENASAINYQMPSESEVGTKWECEFCTFMNEISTRVCQVCCKTNPLLLPSTEIASEAIEDVPLPPNQTPYKTPTKLIEQNEEEEVIKSTPLYERYWAKDQPENPSESSNQEKLNFGSQTARVENRPRSPRGRGNAGQPKNMASRENKSKTNVPEQFNEEDNALGVVKEFHQLTTMKDGPTWECTFCTVENDVFSDICEICAKSNPNKLQLKITGETDFSSPMNGSQGGQSSIQQFDKPPKPEVTNDDTAATDLLALQFMQENHIDSYEIAQMASKLINKNFRLHDAIEAAKNCTTFEGAVAYLQQDCILCDKKHHTRDMIQMLYCTHRFCQNCTRRQFTMKIRKFGITSFACPTCATPSEDRIEVYDDAISDYFASLSEMLKPMLAEEDYEMYQTKLRNWCLARDPNFTNCPNCLFGGILEDNNFNRMHCPQCLITSCLRCKKPWNPEHEGRTCEAFAEWEEEDRKEKARQEASKKNGNKKKGSIMKAIFGMGGNSDKTQDQALSEQETSVSYAGAAASKVNLNNKNQRDHQNRNQQNQNTYQQNNADYPPISTRPSQQHSASQYNQNQHAQQNKVSSISKNTGTINKSRNQYGTGDSTNVQYHDSQSNTSSSYNADNDSNNAQGRKYERNSSPKMSSKKGPKAGTYAGTIWHCPKCTLENKAGVRFCSTCNLSAYDKVDSIIPSENSTTQTYKVSQNKTYDTPDTKWKCKYCPTVNNEGVRICRKCDRTYEKCVKCIYKTKNDVHICMRCGIIANELQTNKLSQNITYATPVEKWDCKHCTTTNNGGVRICITCGRTFGISDICSEESKLNSSSQNIPNSANNISSVNENDFPVYALQGKQEEYLQSGENREMNTLNPNISHTFVDLEGNLQRTSISAQNNVTLVNTGHHTSQLRDETPMDWQQTNNSNYNAEIKNANIRSNVLSQSSYEKKGNETDKRWKLKVEAIKNNFSLSELDIALLQCGDVNPIQWLKTTWQHEINYVELMADRELKKLEEDFNVFLNPVTFIEAKYALVKHKGNCVEAVKECVENSKIKVAEIPSTNPCIPEARLVATEGTYVNVDAEMPINERIYSHTEISSNNNQLFETSIVPRMLSEYNIGIQNVGNREPNLPAIHGQMSGIRPGLPNNSILQNFLKVNTVVDQTVNNVTSMQSQSTIRQIQSSTVDALFATPDGLHTAKPATTNSDEDLGRF